MSTLEKDKSKRSTIAIARLCAMLSMFLPEKIICCGKKAASVHQEVGYKADKLVVIPNGYDLSKFGKDKQAGLALRAEFGLPNDIFLIGKVGRYDPFKDHNNLLSALVGLCSSEIDFKCLLVGRGLTAENDELTARINELDLCDKVILAGQRTDIPAVMNALDLHVLSSSSEGFPNVLAEAMACGTPSVSTDVGDAGEIVEDHRLLCPPKEAEALLRLIVDMYKEWKDQPDLWANRSVRCIEHIKINFSVERMVSAYESHWNGSPDFQ